MFCRHDAQGIVSMLGAAAAGAGVGVDGRGPAGAGGITAGKGAVGYPPAPTCNPPAVTLGDTGSGPDSTDSDEVLTRGTCDGGPCDFMKDQAA
jgi:hypothetical protein